MSLPTTPTISPSNMQTSSAGPSRVRGPASEDWERHREKIIALYLEEDYTLERVIKIMEDEHQFSATRSNYTTKFKEWNIIKNYSEQDWQHVAGTLKRRRLEGKSSEVYRHGRLVPQVTLQRNISRYAREEVDMSNLSTPRGLRVCTPQPSSAARGAEAAPPSPPAEPDVPHSTMISHPPEPNSLALGTLFAQDTDSSSMDEYANLAEKAPTAMATLSLTNAIHALIMSVRAGTGEYTRSSLQSIETGLPDVGTTGHGNADGQVLTAIVDKGIHQLSTISSRRSHIDDYYLATRLIKKLTHLLYAIANNLPITGSDRSDIRTWIRSHPSFILRLCSPIISAGMVDLLQRTLAVGIVDMTSAERYEFLRTVMDINDPVSFDVGMRTILQQVVRLEELAPCEFLLEAHADPNVAYGMSKFCLEQAEEYARDSEDYHMVKLLRRNGATVDPEREVRRSQEHLLAMLVPDGDKSEGEIGRCLDRFQTPGFELPKFLPVDGPAKRGHWKVIEKILSRTKTVTGLNLAFYYALKSRQSDIAGRLLDAGASADTTFELERPSHEFNTPLQLAACSASIDIVKRVIREKTNLSHTDLGTALQAAARRGFLEICVTLVMAGADINTPAFEQRGVKTALEEAAANGRLDVAHFLLAANKDTSRYSEQIPNAVQAARENGFLTVARYIHNWDIASGVSRVDEAGRPVDLLTK